MGSGLPCQHQSDRLVPQPHDHAPRFDDLVGIGRPKRDEPGNRAQRRELLDRLMRRAVLADANRVVREDVDRRHFHERAEPDRRLHVVAEDEERRSVWANLRERQAIDDGPHGVLANAEVHVAAGDVARAQVAGVRQLQQCLG